LENVRVWTLTKYRHPKGTSFSLRVKDGGHWLGDYGTLYYDYLEDILRKLPDDYPLFNETPSSNVPNKFIIRDLKHWEDLKDWDNFNQNFEDELLAKLKEMGFEPNEDPSDFFKYVNDTPGYFKVTKFAKSNDTADITAWKEFVNDLKDIDPQLAESMSSHSELPGISKADWKLLKPITPVFEDADITRVFNTLIEADEFRDHLQKSALKVTAIGQKITFDLNAEIDLKNLHPDHPLYGKTGEITINKDILGKLQTWEPFEAEDELLDKLKDLNFDVKNYKFFDYTAGGYTVSENELDEAEWTRLTEGWDKFQTTLKEVEGEVSELDLKNGIDEAEWIKLKEITAAQWKDAMTRVTPDVPDKPVSDITDTDGWLKWVFNKWMFVGVLVMVAVLCYFCVKQPNGHPRPRPRQVQSYIRNARSPPPSYRRRLVPVNEVISKPGCIAAPTPRSRRLLHGTHAPFADLAYELGISPKWEPQLHARKLTAEVEPPNSMVHEVCEFTGFSQNDLIWVVPLSCIVQIFWIYVGYKIYKSCRRNRSDRNRNNVMERHAEL